MKYIDGFKHQLAEDEYYQSDIEGYWIIDKYYTLNGSGVIRAKAGFAWDGATGSIDTATNMRASLFHDIGCLMVAREQIPYGEIQKVNQMFHNILEEDCMNPMRRWWHFKAVTAHFADGTKPERREVKRI